MPPRDDRAPDVPTRRWRHEFPEADWELVPLHEPTLPAEHVPAGELARQVMRPWWRDSGGACIVW
jgi:hypothetical protein